MGLCQAGRRQGGKASRRLHSGCGYADQKSKGPKPDAKRWTSDFISGRSNARLKKKLVHEGDYVAEVEVQLVDTGEAWSPYLTLEDAERLDDVRDALRRGDLTAAAKLARVFHLTPL
jgi:hypothetical protein